MGPIWRADLWSSIECTKGVGGQNNIAFCFLCIHWSILSWQKKKKKNVQFSRIFRTVDHSVHRYLFAVVLLKNLQWALLFPAGDWLWLTQTCWIQLHLSSPDSPPPLPISLYGIRYMRVSVSLIKMAGSWGYLAGSWREATPYLLLFCYILQKMKQ